MSQDVIKIGLFRKYLGRNVTERQVTEERILAIANIHISGQDVGNPSQVIVVQHYAFRVARCSRLQSVRHNNK